jgi:hypothetical protein
MQFRMLLGDAGTWPWAVTTRTRPHSTAARQSHHLLALRQHFTQHTPMISSTPVAEALGTAGCRGTGSSSARRRPTTAPSHRHRGRSVAVKATGKDSTASPTTRQGPHLRGLVLRTRREDKGNLVSVPLNHHSTTRAAVASHCCGVGMGLLGFWHGGIVMGVDAAAARWRET